MGSDTMVMVRPEQAPMVDDNTVKRQSFRRRSSRRRSSRKRAGSSRSLAMLLDKDGSEEFQQRDGPRRLTEHGRFH